MKRIKTTHLFFGFSFLVTICISFFGDQWLLLYGKSITLLLLLFLCLKRIKNNKYLYLLSILIVIMIDVFVCMGFVKYYTIIAILLALYYAIGTFLLRHFVHKQDFKINKVTPSVMVGGILVGYLVYSISELVLPKLIDQIGFMLLILISLLQFVTVCFFIYITERYEKAICLFVAACCTLFVDAIVPINELYYYNKMFVPLLTITEIGGVYSLTIFFMTAKPINGKIVEDKYF